MLPQSYRSARSRYVALVRHHGQDHPDTVAAREIMESIWSSIPPRPSCSVEGCDKAASKRGMCDKHYQRLRTTGTTDDPLPRQPRTCSVEGCSQPYRAKGLCSTHYNQLKPDRHALTTQVCAAPGCTETIERAYRTDRRFVCSPAHRKLVQWGTDELTGYDWAEMAAGRAHRLGAPVVEVFERLDVFERDGWVCQHCHRPVDREAGPFDPMSPTVDHVIPLTHGGEHSLANAATLHLSCNASKGTGPLGR